MIKDKNFVKSYALDILLIILGTAIFAFGVHFFITPNKMAPGGLTGLSIIINNLTNLPIGGINFVLNIPLFIIGFKVLGKNFMIKTVISIVSFTLITDYLLPFVPTYTNEIFLASIYGAICYGVGIALVLLRSGSTGGMDIINKIITKKIPHIKFGIVMLAGDIVIVTLSMLLFKSLESGLYAMITLTVSSFIINKILYGLDNGLLLYIITTEAKPISKEIIIKIHRGATIVPAFGAYTEEPREYIMCAIKEAQFQKVRKLVYEMDPTAFIIVTKSNEVYGKGFKTIAE